MALNRIYKVVWSKTKGCYVVVSELAKRVGRNKAKAIVISSAAMAMAVSPVLTSTVGAELNKPGTGDGNGVAWGENATGTGYAAVAIGRDANASAYQSVAIGKGALSSSNSAVALGQDAKATASGASALSVAATASGNNAVAIAYKSNASGTRATAIGEESNASSEDGIALGYKTQATAGSAVAIGREVVSSGDSAVALGKGSKATGRGTLALATGSNATGNDSYAIGWASDASAESTMAFGHSSKAKKNYDIAFGRGAETRDQGSGHSIAIGYGASAASNRGGLDSNTTSTGTLNSAGGVAIGTGAYTGINRGDTAINSSVAVGAGAGAGYRGLGADGLPTGNGTDPDDNATVLVKAFGGTTSTLDYFKNTGSANANGFFSYQNVDINEATAVGRNTRAIGDQSVAIGAQSIAGQGSIVIGGNDIQAYDGKKYFKAADPNSAAARSVNDFNAETTPGTGKNNQPITISGKYSELVGVGLDNSYRASYGQDGSTVIGMQAHSTTPLGVAIGTNSIVRKGAFGATAIGSGASVLANAEAAVAIGMGSEAQGNYAVAAGTAARAKESAVAAGYSANAEVNAVAVGNKSVSKESAVAVGDQSEAINSSVAVGQLAKAQKVADIAVGQGAVASGEQGAIAVGLGTQAQGDSSIMIGGSEITKVAAQTVKYQKEKKDNDGHTVIKTTTKVEHIGGEDVHRTIRSVEMEDATGSIQDAYSELTNGRNLDTATLNYALAANKNGHGSISMGIHSLSTGDLGTAIGSGARVTKLGGVALGTGAISELQNGVAIGTGSRADANSIGTRQTDISYDKEGRIVPFDSKNVAYTFYWAGGTNTSEGDVVSFGTPGAERQLKNVAAGRIADDSTDAINGSQLNSVTKRMSSGWAVEAEKDKDSSGVLKLNGAVATAGTEVYSEDGKTMNRVNEGTATGQVDKVRLNDEVKFRVGDNLVLHQQDGSRPVYEDPDNPNRKTGARVTSKFTYSLNPVLTGLTSAEFKDAAGNKTVIDGNGVTVTPVTQGKEAVSLTTTGLNNGGNAISNVASNLPSTKNSDVTTGPSNATTSQEVPNTTNKDGNNYVSPNNAATVGDVLNIGWNLQGNNTAVDFVKPYDTVNFIDGEGTTATVASTDGKTSTVKYSVNLGEGLKKDDATNKITVNAADKSLTVDTNGVKVNPADKSLEVTDAGLKVKTDGTTITTDNTNGLKVVTGEIESVTTGANPGTVKVKDGDTGKIATVDSVVNAVNSAAFTLKASATTGGIRNTGSSVTETGESIKAGSTVEMIAGKNLDVKHDTSGKITFATVDTPSFTTVQVGGDEGPKFSKTADGNISVSDKDGTNPVKITNVKDGDISENSNDAINGSQFHAVAKNTIKLAGQNGADTATETAAQDLDKKGGIKFTVKSSDGSLLEVAAEGDTITLTPKTGTITTTDGVPTATTTNGKLVTADEVVNALKEMGWKATAGNEGTGTVIGNALELIKAGETVTFKAGDNLAVKQDGKNFIYSLKTELTGLTSGEFKNTAGDKTVINGDGVTITPVTNGKSPVSLTTNGLNNGGNPITNVGGNLDGAKADTDAPTTKHEAPNTTDATGPNYVNPNNAATVGDVLQAGWNLQNNGTEKDFVKPYDTVNFADGNGTTAVVETTENKVSTVKYNVNVGNGLEKNDANQITIKPGDTSLEVTNEGVKVKKADESLEVTNDGLKVKIDGTTITTGNNGLQVNTGTINTSTTGTVAPNTGDDNKVATVANIANAINNAAFTLKASATAEGTRNANGTVPETGELIKAGNTVELVAGKNLDVKHDTNGKITFATKDNVTFTTVQVGGDQGPKFSKSADGDIKVSGSDNTAPVKITNVKPGDISETSTDAINGSQFHGLAKNTIKLAGKTGDLEATETAAQDLDKKGGIKFTVKSSDGSLLEVAAEGDTITLTPKTGKITTGTDGVPTANTDGGKLVTADQLVTALTEMGWKATADQEGTGTVTGNATELIKAGNTVTFKAGDNLAIKQDGKNFIYSLNPALTGLTSAEFKDGKNNKVNITPEGITITKPADPTANTPENTVTLNQNGLNNGGNAISNVKSNLPETKNSDTANTEVAPSNATKVQAAPNTTNTTGDNYVNPNNAATVSDVLNAGWNLQGNNTAVDFVKPYDTVNFIDGDGTTATVASTDGKTSTVKYSVNLGNGLQKDDTGNTISVKPADSSLVVDGNGVKVNTGTINNVTTGDKAGTVEANTGDENKAATVGNVVNAINNAAWTATSAATSAGELGATAADQLVKSGDKVTFEADKNIKITQAGSKFTFATKDNVTFTTVQVGGDEGPKFSKTDAGDIKVSGSDNTAPVKITNVKPGDISETSTDAINGSQFHGLAKNTIKLAGKTGDLEATETAAQDLDKKGGIKFTVKSSDGSLLEVAAEGDTITLTPKTGKITTDTDGVPTANTEGGKLVTADQLVTALTEMGWKATAGNEGTGTVTGNALELIKAGETVTFKAGDNLAVKQDGKNFIYSLNPALTGLTSAEFKDGDNKVKITPTGITITKPADPTAGTPENTVTLNQNGLNNGGNPITNVGGNLDGAKAGTDAPTTKHEAPNTTEATGPNYVNPNNAATVGDVLQAGWNLQNNGTEKDFVKPYDTVNFADGNGTTAVVETTENKVSTVKYNVNVGNGLEKNDANQITVKPADSSLVVDAAGVKVNTGTINKVETGDKAGTVEANTGDTNKIATVGNVVEAINNAAFTLKTSATAEGTRNANGTVPETGELIKAGNTVELVAGKNLDVKHDTNGKITFATKDNVSFETVQLGGDQGPKFSKSADGDIKVSGSDNAAPVKITNVKPGDISETSTDAINGSQFHGLAKNTIKLAGKTGDLEATETAAQDLDKKGGIKFTVKSSDGSLLEVAAEGDTITLTPKTGTITTTDGVPTATTTNGKLVTADEVVNALKEMGWKATAGNEGTGTVTGNALELIKAGETVTFKAGDNLAVKQDGKNFIYSLKTELTGLTSGEFKNTAGDKTVINGDGVTITPVTNGKSPVSLTTNGLNNGGNPITNVTSNLVNYTDPEVNGVQPAKNSLRNLDDTSAANTNAATVGDLRNMGWIVSSDKKTDDLTKAYSETVKNANEVKFVGEGAAIVSGKTEGDVRTITVKVDNQTSTNNAITPVVYTDEDGNQVYPTSKKDKDGNQIFNKKPDGTGEDVTGPVKTTINGPKGTDTPTTLSNVEGNLDGAKTGTNAPTTKHEGVDTTNPTATNYVNPNNAATVGDVLQAGWNLQNNGAEKDFVKPYDTVNFADGNGTTAVVETTENKVSTVKYNVNVGNGLEKNDANQITVKPADSSLVVDAAGVKVNTGTINNVTTGDKPGTVTPNTGDDTKLATVTTVVNAINNAAWTATSAKTEVGELGKDATNQLVKAGDKVTFEADKNIKITQDAGKFTFATKDNVSFETVQVGGDQGPKLSKSADGDIKVSGSDNTAPVKITNVKPGDISETSTDAINGSQFHGLAKNTIKLAGKTGDLEATETAAQDLDKKGGIKFTVKSSDGSLLEVAAEGDTITLTPKTGKITTGTDGVPTANTDGGKLVTADQLVAALTEMGWKATAGNEGTGTVTGNATELIKAGNTVTFKAGDNLAVKQDGKNFIYSLKTELTGLISAEFKDGKNNKVNITPEGITITKPADPTANTPENTVKLNQNGLNNGGNPITNVGGNLDGAKTGTNAPTTKHEGVDTTNPTATNYVNPNNAATVGDVLQAGWNLQNNGAEKDFVKPYDTVNFADGNGTTAVVETTENKVSTVKYNVNVGNGLEKNDANQITVKPADSSLVVDAAGVKVNTGTINKVETGDKAGTVEANTGDTNKIATVGNVVEAINNAAFTLKTSATAEGTRNANGTVPETGELIKAGNTVELVAGKNLDVKHDTNGKITFATKDNVSFETVQLGGDQGPKFSKSADGDIKVSGSDNTAPVKITNVKPGDISETSTDAINGSQFHGLAKNTIKLAGKTGDLEATETAAQDLDKKGGIKFTVKSSDGSLLEVAAEGDTITLTPKTGKITTGTDGVPTANTDGGKLVTADQLVTALTEMGWKATAGNEGTGTVTGNVTELIKAGNTVTFKAGDNLAVKQDGKNFIYSLKTELTGLTSAEFKDAKNNTVNITPEGITITKPADPTAGTPENTVTLNQNGLNNGGNAISNVKSNLPDTKNSDTANTEVAPSNATKVQAAPNTTNTTGDNYVNPNNAATVSDVLNAGWNLQGNNTAVDFVKPYDTVNFIDGDGTTATVASTDGKTSTVKYSVNLGNGLQKDDTGNTISVKPADSSLVVDGNGVKVNTGTINNVTTGDKTGTVTPNTGDDTKLATVTTVVNAINNAAWTATSAATAAGELGANATNQLVKAGDKVTFEADKNIKITQAGSQFTFATKDNVTFTTVQVGGDQGPKFSKSADGDIKVSGSDNTAPVKITNVKPGDISETSTDAINGSQFHGLAKNTIKLAGKTGDLEATETAAQDLDKKGGIKFTVKSSDGSLLEVAAEGDTITLTPKTGKITTGTDGVPTANTDGGKLVTADQLVTALTEMGWKATAGNEGTGTVTGNATELIKAGNTVTFKAGDNLSIKQDGKNFIYSLKTELTGLTSAEFKDAKNNTVNITPEGITITKPADPTAGTPENTVTLNQNGLNNGGNAISNVKSNLPDTKNSDTANTEVAPSNATKVQAAPNTTNTTGDNYVNPNNAATVSDVLNAGWNLQGNGEAKDFVKAYDTVNFINGDGTTATVESIDGKTSTVKYSVKLGNGLQKDDTGNTISVKPADSSLVVDGNGVKVNTGTINNVTTGDKPGTVEANTGDENKVATVGNVVSAINNAAWTATSGKTEAGELGKDATNQLVKAGDKVTFEADKNIKITQDGSTFTFATKDNVSFNTVQIGGDQGPKLSKTDDGDLKVSGPNGTDPVKVTNVKSGLDKYGDQVNGADVPGTTDKNRGLVDLSKPENGQPKVSDNTAATVGDLRNMGWIVSSDKTTGADGSFTTDAYSAQVKHANEVKFVGTGTAIVSGTTDDKGVRTITVKVDDQTSTNKSVTPVVYTDENGKQVYPTGKVDQDGNQIFNTKPDGSGDTVTGPVKTTINGPKGTTTPTTLSNVEGNLDGAKTGTTAPTTNHAGVDTTNPAANNYVNPHNAATVGDVLNAGWNLQNNGTARDFVKPYDTVNFVNGVNTTAVVTTSDNGTTSNVTYNVTGLPMTYTDEAGNPVSKIGDKFYKVNDKGQPVDANGKPSTKVNNNGEPLDENGTVIQPINTATNPLHSTLVNPNVTNTADAPNKQTTSPTQLGNVTSGLNKYGDNIDGKPVAGTTTANTGLIDLSKPTNGDAPKVSDNTAATVGDLRNMGWLVSSDKVTNDDGTATVKDYTEQVRNANEVKFVGKGTAIVSGKTDANGVRTITVKVDDQVSTNNAIMPTSFTTKDGTKVYPVKDDAGNVTYHTTPDGKGNGDTTIDPKNVVTAVNGPNGTTTPTTLQNVKSNLPNVDDKKQKAFHPDGTEVTEPNSTTNTGNAKAPLSHTVVAAMMSPFMTNDKGEFIDANGNVTTDPKQYVRNPNFAANNAATVGDVLQAGWNLQNNGTAKDFVKPYDTVNFINGLGTTAVVTTREGNTTSDVTFNVKAANGSVTVDEDGVKVTTGEITNNTNGSVSGSTTAEKAKLLRDTLEAAQKELQVAKDALKEAETKLTANPTDTTLQKEVADKKAELAAKQTPKDEAQKAHDEAGLNKVATVQNVAEAINNAGFNLKTSADGGEKLTTGTKNDGELIKPSNTVEMVAGNNLTVKQDANGKITYATKDNVTFTNVDTGTLNVGSPNTYTDGKGNTYTKVGDQYYKPADVVNGAPKEGATPVTIPADVVVKPVSPVTMKTEAAKPATNNVADAQPSSALNITSQDGKPTQITGVGSTLNTNVVKTNPEGTATKPGATPGTTPKTEDVHLVDLNGTKDAPVNKNAVATVGDLQNMGWVVSAKDGNGYKDVVKNANVVDFKGENGITVTGSTLEDGTRQLTVGIKEGEVTNKVIITHADGTKTEAVKIGDNYYKVDENGKPVGFEKDKDGKPAGTPLTINPTTDAVTNKGAGLVTGNTVANAIQDSGWNIGKANGSDVVKSDGTPVDFNKEAKVYDKVNPNDDMKFVDGANTNVSMVTVDALNEDGTKKATTFVKVDINRDLKIDSVTTGGTAVDKNGNNLVKVGDKYYKEGDVTVVTNADGSTSVTPKKNAKPVPPADVIPPKDGAMIVKNVDGKDVVSAKVDKDGNGAFAVSGKDGKDGVSITAKDGQGAIGVNGKDGKNTSITGENISIKDKDNNNSTSIGINNVTLKDKDGNTSTLTADKSELKDKAGNTNTNTSTTNVLKDTNGNTNTSTAAGTTYTDKDANKTVVGPKEINITDKSGDNTASLTNKDLILNAKDPKTGVDKTSHVSGDKIAFTTTDEIEKVVDKDGKPVIDPTTGKQKEVIKNPGNSTEYTSEGLKVIPNSTVARDANGNLTFLDKDGKPVSKDVDGNYKYVGQDGKPGEKYTGAVGSLKPNVADSTRIISFGMDKPVLDSNGNPVKGPDGKTVMTEGISAGMQQIHNVAPGTKDTDAVNVSQLRGTTININNRMNRMGAQAAALAGLQSIQYDPLEPTQISAGVGYYQGASALALGMNHYKNESTMFHVGASVNGNMNEVMANASVTWKFGARADETAVKDTFRQGPISASYTLQDKVSALEAQNRIQKDELNELRATNAAQKAENEAQREELALMKAQIAELFKRMNG